MLKLTTADMDYVTDDLGINMGKHPGAFRECLKAMEKYESHWWLKFRNGDAKILAAHQIDEPVLLIPKDIFLNGVSAVLGRKVKEDELHSWNAPLIAEFHEKYEAMAI